MAWHGFRPKGGVRAWFQFQSFRGNDSSSAPLSSGYDMHGWACVCVAGISIEMGMEGNGSSNMVCICDYTRGKFGQVRLGKYNCLGFWTSIDRSKRMVCLYYNQLINLFGLS